MVADVRVVRLKTPYRNHMSRTRRMFAFALFMLRATWVATTTKADLIFASSTPLTVAVPALIASAVRRVPFVFEVRDLWPSVPAQLGYLKPGVLLRAAQALERLAYRRARRIIALSPDMREGILQTHPVADVVVVPNAADIELFRGSAGQRKAVREARGWQDATVAIYAGSLGDLYNIDWVIDLAVFSQAVTVQVFGEGRAAAGGARRLTELGRDPSQTLRGRVGKPELIDALTAADLCISSMLNHPALHPSSLNKVFDALAAGKPVVFNHDGWLSDLVVRAGAGWRLDDDPRIAAAQLDELAADPLTLRTAATASRNLAHDFDRDRLYGQFKRALEVG